MFEVLFVLALVATLCMWIGVTLILIAVVLSEGNS